MRLASGHHENRSTRTLVTIHHAGGTQTVRIDQKSRAPLKGFISLGNFRFEATSLGRVTISTEGADGFVHVDALQIVSHEEAR